MRIPSLSTRRAVTRRQQGATLIIAMILLMIVTLLAVTGLRSTNQQERMSASAYDRDLAFQAAEAALRAGELRAATINDSDFPNAACTCVNGLCSLPGDACTTRWSDFANFVDVPDSELNIEAADTPQRNPQYMIEKLGMGRCATTEGVKTPDDCRTQNFRITAKSNDSGDNDDRSTVILQSIYAQKSK